MSGASFLDTGVVLGFCFRDDKHHVKCRDYIRELERQLYISDHVEAEYVRKEPDLAERYSDGVFEHISRLRKSNLEGQLDSMDLSQIRQNKIRGNNPAATTLHDFYENQVPNFILVDELVERLRDLARDIEQHALGNREELMDRTEVWERETPYEELMEILSSIHEEDRIICIDAHDVASVTEMDTELATTNPNDLVVDGHRELIVENTEIDDVISLAVTA